MNVPWDRFIIRAMRWKGFLLLAALAGNLACRPRLMEEEYGFDGVIRIVVILGPMRGDTAGLDRYTILWSETWMDRLAGSYPGTPLPLINTNTLPKDDAHYRRGPTRPLLSEGDTIFDRWFREDEIANPEAFPETLRLGWLFFDICNGRGCEPNVLYFHRRDGRVFPDTSRREFVVFREGWVVGPYAGTWPEEEMFYRPFRRTSDILVFRVPLLVRDSIAVVGEETTFVKVVQFSWDWEALRGVAWVEE